MDIESLAKELILKNMNSEQQLAVLEGIKASVAQAKEVQKQRIGENVGLVVDALKRLNLTSVPAMTKWEMPLKTSCHHQRW